MVSWGCEDLLGFISFWGNDVIDDVTSFEVYINQGGTSRDFHQFPFLFIFLIIMPRTRAQLQQELTEDITLINMEGRLSALETNYQKIRLLRDEVESLRREVEWCVRCIVCFVLLLLIIVVYFVLF